MTDFTGGTTLKLGQGDGPPETFVAIPGLITPPTVGVTNPLVDVTDFDSAAKEYIGGLPDGNEINASFHLDVDGTTNTQLEALKTAVNNKSNVNIQVEKTDGTNTQTFEFAVTPLSWSLGGGGPEEVNTIDFTLKISGAITQS